MGYILGTPTQYILTGRYFESVKTVFFCEFALDVNPLRYWCGNKLLDAWKF